MVFRQRGRDMQNGSIDRKHVYHSPVQELELNKDRTTDPSAQVSFTQALHQSGISQKKSIVLSTGLFVQYFFQSLCKTFFSGSRYPFFKRYLNLPAHVYSSIYASWSIVWSLKLFLAILSDCFPIFKYRRKPYIILGWTLTLSTLFSIALYPVPEPYFEVANCTRTAVVSNPDTESHVFKYAMLLGAAKFGMAITDCASDGLLVEYTRSEPIRSRGSINSISHLLQKLGSFVTLILLALLMNGPSYGGFFCFEASLRVVAAVYGVVAFPAIFNAAFEVNEQPHHSQICPRAQMMSSLWRQLCSVATIRVAAFVFLYMFMYSFQSSAEINIKHHWADVSPFVANVNSILSALLQAIGILLYKKYLLNVSWRLLTVVCFLATTMPAFVVLYITVFDVARNQWLYHLDDWIEAAPEGMMFIIIMVISAEMSSDKLEGTTFALFMSIYTLALPVAKLSGNIFSGLFDVSSKDRFLSDTNHDRQMVFASILSCYIIKLCILPFVLYILPVQKEHIASLKKESQRSNLIGATFCVTFCILFVFSLVVSGLSLFQSTSCLKIVGGRGC